MPEIPPSSVNRTSKPMPAPNRPVPEPPSNSVQQALAKFQNNSEVSSQVRIAPPPASRPRSTSTSQPPTQAVEQPTRTETRVRSGSQPLAVDNGPSSRTLPTPIRPLAQPPNSQETKPTPSRFNTGAPVKVLPTANIMGSSNTSQPSAMSPRTLPTPTQVSPRQVTVTPVFVCGPTLVTPPKFVSPPTFVTPPMPVIPPTLYAPPPTLCMPPPTLSVPPPLIIPPPTLAAVPLSTQGHIKKITLDKVEVFTIVKGVSTSFGQHDSLEILQIDEGVASINTTTAITLKKDMPTVLISPMCYLLADGGTYYIVKLSVESPEFLEIMSACSEYHEPVVVEPVEVEGENENTKKADAAATKIEAGGTVVAQGFIKGAQFIGVGIRKTTDVVIENSDKGEREVSEEEKKRIEERQKSTQAFLKGTRTVAGGIGKGVGFVGRGIAKGVQKGQEMAGKDKPPEKENATKKSAVGVAGATANAFGSIKTGICESTRIVSADIRDNSVRATRHKEGEEAAKLHEQQFNMAGQVAVGTLHTASIAASTTVKVAVSVGAAAATYDHNWEALMNGAPWKAGWLSSQDNTLDPWTSKWFVLRTYSLAMYKDKEQDPLKPIVYIPLNTIKSVEPVEFKLTKKEFCFKIITKSSVHFLSVDSSDLKSRLDVAGRDDVSQEEPQILLEKWMESIFSLSQIINGLVTV